MTREEHSKLKRKKLENIIMLSLIIFISIGAFIGIIFGYGENNTTKFFLCGFPATFLVGAVFQLIDTLKWKLPEIDEE